MISATRRVVVEFGVCAESMQALNAAHEEITQRIADAAPRRLRTKDAKVLDIQTIKIDNPVIRP